jgi:hypothetical protein
MRVAGRQFAEGVADANDRTAIELVVWHTFAFDPAAVSKAVAVLATKPLLAAEFFGFFAGRRGHGDQRNGWLGSWFNRMMNENFLPPWKP